MVFSFFIRNWFNNEKGDVIMGNVVFLKFFVLCLVRFFYLCIILVVGIDLFVWEDGIWMLFCVGIILNVYVVCIF